MYGDYRLDLLFHGLGLQVFSPGTTVVQKNCLCLPFFLSITEILTAQEGKSMHGCVDLAGFAPILMSINGGLAVSKSLFHWIVFPFGFFIFTPRKWTVDNVNPSAN